MTGVAPVDAGPVGRAAAAAAFERLGEGLAAAADHLVGPGMTFARKGLADAGRAAFELARLHQPGGGPPATPEDDAVAYVADLLGPDAAKLARERIEATRSTTTRKDQQCRTQ